MLEDWIKEVRFEDWIKIFEDVLKSLFYFNSEVLGGGGGVSFHRRSHPSMFQSHRTWALKFVKHACFESKGRGDLSGIRFGRCLNMF